MADMTEHFDPDRWIAKGRALAHYPILEPISLHARLVDVVFGDKRELAGHVRRWMARVAEARARRGVDQHESVQGALTEENLRSLWEETRTGMGTRSADDVERDVTFSVSDDVGATRFQKLTEALPHEYRRDQNQKPYG